LELLAGPLEWPDDKGPIKGPFVQEFLDAAEQTSPRRAALVAVGAPLGDLVPVPDDFALREVFDVDLNDWDSVFAFVVQWGLSSTPRYHPDGRSRVWELFDERELIRSPRNLALLWLAHDRGESVVGCWPDDTWPDTEENQERRWRGWFDMLNKGLDVWQMHVTGDLPTGDYSGWRLTHELAQTTPYRAAVRQVAMIATSGAQIRICANERCGRAFTKQRGRAVYAARDRGVKYCSHSCAKAQSERERRARRKAVK
jgi:hypothetical protein